MSDGRPQVSLAPNRANRIVAGVCVAFFVGMIGASYAAVPLYAMFCRVTGYGGTTQRVTQYADRVLDRKVTIRFDANVAGGLPWEFRPDQREVTIKIGETAKIGYTARNLFETPSSGRATFNVTPELAGAYFNKVECFCFTETSLKPGETLDMPVVFYVDPDIITVPELKNIQTITLSYTFFPDTGEKPVAEAPAAVQGERGTKTESIGG
ncbi:MAG: cytochrome c oxidase assembly protein [Rhizobiales bacterium]|nr:cytochrome c oxidase assembly protein [Hyphomicrobiales bacterium]